MLRRLQRNLIGSVLCGLVLSGIAGCGSGSPSAPRSLITLDPVPKPTASPAPPSSTPVRSARLAELAAATAVVRHYYAIANALRRHMDAAALAALFTPACPCQAQARAVRRAAAKHEHYVDQATLNALRPSLQDRTHAYVLVDLNASRGGLVRSDGARITSVPAQRHVQRVFRLALINGHWRIYRIEAA